MSWATTKWWVQGGKKCWREENYTRKDKAEGIFDDEPV